MTLTPDPETELRAIWDAQGVPGERQDAVIAGIAAAAQPGAMAGPFSIPDHAYIAVAQIIPGANDRTAFDARALQELAASIRDNGLAQPITVRPGFVCASCEAFTTDEPAHCPACGHSEYFPVYQIVAGERRFRACKLLGWPAIPAIVRQLSDEQAAAIMLAENTSRADLDPIDEGRAYQARIAAFGWSIEDCARQAGVSEIRVQFRLKLLRLRPNVQELVRKNILSLGYAQILADANLDTDRQQAAVTRLIANPNPTPGWFRKEAYRLADAQDQGALFEALPLLSDTPVAAAPALLIPEPPTPATATPPRTGRNLREIVSGQIGFWQEAAEAWGNLGKPFKKQECQAAAQALQLAFASI